MTPTTDPTIPPTRPTVPPSIGKLPSRGKPFTASSRRDPLHLALAVADVEKNIRHAPLVVRVEGELAVGERQGELGRGGRLHRERAGAEREGDREVVAL